MNAFWRFVLALVPTRALQAGLAGRPDAKLYFVTSDKIVTVEVPGPAIITITHD